MAIYSGDQPLTTGIVVNGVVVETASAAVLDALALPGGAANYGFSANSTLVYNGATLGFRAGVIYPCDPALLAALNAASAPIVAV